MKGKKSTILLILIFVIGLSLLLYPSVSNYWNSFRESRALAGYVGAVAHLDEKEYQAILSEARGYNETLLDMTNRFSVIEERSHERYMKALSVNEDGIMGYVAVKKLGISLPIYHTTDDSVLQHGIGHLEGSSLPVGGTGTHCVISGHRGLPSAKLFSDLDRLEVGDTFVLNVLEETMTYEVDQIRIVLPEDTEELAIDPMKDYCTLFTCTPYGINSHRMLVRGHRVENEADLLRIRADALKVDTVIVAAFLAIPLLLIALAIMLFQPQKKK